MEVIIDGVKYVPITEIIQLSPNMEAITKGLLSSFWDEHSLQTKPLPVLLKGIRIRVFDDDKGDPIEDVLANIARRL